MRTISESEFDFVEVFIRNVLDKYPEYLAEERMYERWLAINEKEEVQRALIIVNMKVAVIQSWFDLLNQDERFVLDLHLIQKLEWPRIAFSFSERWGGEFTRSERTLVSYQASGLKKIVAFIKEQHDMVIPLFADIWQASKSEI